jgi:hypothetical protein
MARGYVVMAPTVAVCAARAAARPDGRTADSTSHEEFHALFEDAGPAIIREDTADACDLPARIAEGIAQGTHLLP